MFQAVALRDDKVGYKLHNHDLPKDYTTEIIPFLPEVATKEVEFVKYISKFTHISGNIIIKLARSDGFDPFGRPKSMSYSLLIPPEEYNMNNLYYYASPLIYSEKFSMGEKDTINETEIELLTENDFKKKKIEILDVIPISKLREIIVAAMIEPKVIIKPGLDLEKLIALASVIDKAIPFEASYDFSLITYADKSCKKYLLHNVIYFFSKQKQNEETVEIANKKSAIVKIAKNEAEYLDEYINLIIKEDYEKLLSEHAKWVIGMYYQQHKELQQAFTKRYQLDMPFSRRNKFHAKFVEKMSKLLK